MVDSCNKPNCEILIVAHSQYNAAVNPEPDQFVPEGVKYHQLPPSQSKVIVGDFNVCFRRSKKVWIRWVGACTYDT